MAAEHGAARLRRLTGCPTPRSATTVCCARRAWSPLAVSLSGQKPTRPRPTAHLCCLGNHTPGFRRSRWLDPVPASPPASTGRFAASLRWSIAPSRRLPPVRATSRPWLEAAVVGLPMRGAGWPPGNLRSRLQVHRGRGRDRAAAGSPGCPGCVCLAPLGPTVATLVSC